MGLMDKARAVAAEAKAQAEHVKQRADDRFADTPAYTKLKSQAEGVGAQASEAAKRAKESTAHRAARFGATAAGLKVGDAVRKVGTVVSQLPVLSAASDAMKAKNCVDLLADELRRNPTSAQKNLWLAEALLKTRRDLRRYRVARGVIDPSSFVVAAAAEQAAALGPERTPTYEQLLRRSWLAATQDVLSRPRDGRALHVLSRVYLATGHPESALKVARRALLADPTDGSILISMARAYGEIGDQASQRRAAELAVERGCSLGRETLAQLELARCVEAKEGTTRSRTSAYETAAEQVTIADLRGYWGAARRPEEIAAALRDVQLDKAREAKARVTAALNASR